jgi:hypothetical protein
LATQFIHVCGVKQFCLQVLEWQVVLDVFTKQEATRSNNKQYSISISFMRRFSSSIKAGSSSSGLLWRPRTADEIARKKHRRVISQHLKRIGKSAGRELSLDEYGVCCFTFKKFVVVVEVPEDNSSICVFYSKVCHVRPEDNGDEVLRVIDLFNERQVSAAGGGFLELADSSTSSESTVAAADPLHGTTRLCMRDEEEVNLCFEVPIQGLSFEDTATHLERFIKTAVLANRKLYTAKTLPRPLPLPVEEPALCHRPRLWSLDSQPSVSDMSQRKVFSLFSLSCS